MGRGRGRKRRRRGPTRRPPQATVTGKLTVTRRGYGFAVTSEGDYFISRHSLHGAMDGDTVAVRPRQSGEGGRRRGSIDHVIARAHDSLIGTYEIAGGLGVVIPYDPRVTFDVFCRPDDFPDAHDGDLVNVRIINYPARGQSATGQITHVIAGSGDKGIAERVLIGRLGIETEFSRETVAEARGKRLDVSAALAEPDRRDLRSRFVFTIDPADARDFDDAISIERIGEGGVRLGVHIADVSTYVPIGSSLDLTARRRGTSVYLPDRVIPMLPEELSADLCSLQPGCERLAFTADIVLDADMEVTFYELYPSVISSDLRLDYGRVQGMFEGTEPYPSDEAAHALKLLCAFAERRHAMRLARGAVDFDSVEPKISFDEAGEVAGVTLRHRTEATGVIEEAMILANEVVASHMERYVAPMVYRVHDLPAADAAAELARLLAQLGYQSAGVAELEPHAIQRVLEACAHRPDGEFVIGRVLRTMQRAVYASANIGHFGLASESYCHFTSPIRRYPDLLVHRLLRAQLGGFFDRSGRYSAVYERQSALSGVEALNGINEIVDQLDALCSQCSRTERAAAEAESESVQIKLCEYMERFIGSSFIGTVVAVAPTGLTVMLPTTVRGQVRTRALGNEYFVFDEEHQALMGESTGRVWRLGQTVQVVLEDVSVRSMTVDFSLRRPSQQDA